MQPVQVVNRSVPELVEMVFRDALFAACIVGSTRTSKDILYETGGCSILGCRRDENSISIQGTLLQVREERPDQFERYGRRTLLVQLFENVTRRSDEGVCPLGICIDDGEVYCALAFGQAAAVGQNVKKPFDGSLDFPRIDSAVVVAVEEVR